MNIFPPEVWEQIKPIFAEGFPNETVVAVYFDCSFKHLPNISESPRSSFKLDRDITVALAAKPPKVLLHSHINQPIAVSDMDSHQQAACGYAWGIVGVIGNETTGQIHEVREPECWGMEEYPPLVGRTYLWGIRDCVSLAQDYYKSIGLRLPTFPRMYDAARHPEIVWAADQIRHRAEKAGFKRVNRDQRKPNDFITQCWGARGANVHDHCLVYLGEGKYMHQMRGRNSEIWVPHNEEHMLMRYQSEVWRPPFQK